MRFEGKRGGAGVAVNGNLVMKMRGFPLKMEVFKIFGGPSALPLM
jgi:hypothetical protein